MPLHTDDPGKPENVDDETYFTELAEHAERVGAEGLHTIPSAELEAAYARLGAGSGEDR